MRLIVFLTLPLICILFFALWHTRSILHEESLSRVKSHLYEQVQHQAAEISAELAKIESVANVAANILNIHSQMRVSYLKQFLSANISEIKTIYGAAVAYVPNTYKDKRLFAPYMYRDGETLKYIDISVDAYDYTDPQWQWWNGPRSTSESIWTNPYFDEGAGGTLMVTYSVPFFSKNKFSGVTTVDVDVMALYKTLSLKGLSSEDYAIVTNTGNFAYHYKKELIGQSIFDLAKKFNSPKASEFARLMTTGGSGIFEYNVDGENILSFYAPVGHFGWSFAIRISEKKALSLSRLDDNSLFIWTAIFIIAAISLTFFITSLYIIKPLQNTSERLRELTNDKQLLHADFDIEEFSQINELLSDAHRQVHEKISQSRSEQLNSEKQLLDKVSALKRTEHRYKSLLHSEYLNRIIIDASGKILSMNNSAAQSLQLNFEMTPLLNIFELIHSKNADALARAIASLEKTSEPQFIDHILFINDSNQITGHLLLTPSDNAEGNIIITFLTSRE